MRKARFEFSEVALSQVETVYETIKSFVSSNNYESLKIFLNRTLLSAKQYYYLLDVLIDDDKLFNDTKFAKILFSSELQYLNDDYHDIFGEPLAQTLLYKISVNLSSEMIYELFMDEESKINFKDININIDNVLQVVIDQSKNFTNEQFDSLVKLLVYKKGNSVKNKNDYDKNALELFLYRKRTNKNVFDVLYKEYKKFEKESFEKKMKFIEREMIENEIMERKLMENKLMEK